MKKSKVKETLADKISGILSTAPASVDPEEETDDTRAKLLNEDLSEDDDVEEELLSKFRKQNIDLLGDVDEKYAGTRGSRKSLRESDESSDNDDSHDEISEENEEAENETASEKENSDNEDTEENNSDSEGESDVDDEDNSILNEDTDFKHINQGDVSLQVKKGLCVRNQMSLWESLLEMRIQLQKCLITSNKMPQYRHFKEIKKNSANEFSNKVSETKTILTNVLEKLLTLQKIVLKKYPETKNLDKNQETKGADDDEEIPSDTEEELEESEDEADEEKPKKRRKLNDFEEKISNDFNKYRNYRNSVIQKWNEKTRLAVSKNNETHSVLRQIEHNLQDKKRLAKRTQLKRSDYAIIGQNKEETLENDDEKPTEEYNPEIFDDDDFYHQLLRELIEVKSADLTDPVQLGRQWVKLQNLRSKMKRKIDTKATKGRKIRYAVHTKLVNFMAPIIDNSMPDEAKNELYASLFGKKG